MLNSWFSRTSFRKNSDRWRLGCKLHLRFQVGAELPLPSASRAKRLTHGKSERSWASDHRWEGRSNIAVLSIFIFYLSVQC